MQIYLVGGAVRDRLLGIPIKDRDYVVVGATPQDMLRLGYKPVGKDFPVFLHPESGEEYALARTERKTGRGYHAFAFQADATVTLAQDLARRDLTINAMAEDEHGTLIDPYDGAHDLRQRILRHVAPAFVEDPVRILRVARFAARYAHCGFRVADETCALMQQMTRDGETDHLVPERIWAEMRKALSESTPSVFLQVLRACGALKVLFPEVEVLYGVPQPAKSHSEIDTGVHIERMLDAAARLAPGDTLIGWCALTYDLGKALAPADVLPQSIDYEHIDMAPLRAMAARLKVPTEYMALAELVCRLHPQMYQLFELPPETLLKLLEQLDAFRRPERVQQFALVCECDQRGQLGREHDAYPQTAYLLALHAAAAVINAQPFVAQGLSGMEIGNCVRAARLQAIVDVCAAHRAG